MAISLDQKNVNKLKGFIDELERLDGERRDIAEQSKAIFDTAKAAGFSVRAIREVLKLRREEVEERCEHITVLDAYCHALGVEVEPPLLARMEKTA